MKITDLLKHIREERLDAELGDYHLVGKWGDREASHSFRHPDDRKMVQHPVAIRNAHKKFGKTEHMLNLYFVNLPGASRYAEHGFMEPKEIATALPKAWPEIRARAEEANHGNAINVIFVGNAGFQRMPMTPWIMAHRLGHALAASQRKMHGVRDAWTEYEMDFVEFMAHLLSDVYNWQLPKGNRFWRYRNEKTLTKFFEAIGTMRSARKNQLGNRPYEFLYELFAQHIIQGTMKFNPLPTSFGSRGGIQVRIFDEDAAEMWSRDLNTNIADHLGTRVDNCLYSAEGKFLVM